MPNVIVRHVPPCAARRSAKVSIWVRAWRSGALWVHKGMNLCFASSRANGASSEAVRGFRVSVRCPAGRWNDRAGRAQVQSRTAGRSCRYKPAGVVLCVLDVPFVHREPLRMVADSDFLLPLVFRKGEEGKRGGEKKERSWRRCPG